MLKIIDNPMIKDKEEAEKALRDMEKKYGKRYCPCALRQEDDTICICKQFREQDVPGECHCGRYVKIEVDN